MAKRRPKTKPASGIEKKIEASMRAANLVFARHENVQKRVTALAKRIYGMPPAQRAVAIVTFNLMTGKKDLRRFLESDLQLPPSACDELEPLLESIMMDLQHAAVLMEDESGEFDLHDLRLVIDAEPELLKLMEIVEVYDSPNVNFLTVAKLNEELQKATGKVASSDKDSKETKKQKQLQRFFHFFSLFTSRLAELGVKKDDDIAKFLITITNMVPRIQVKRNEEAMKNHGK